MEPGKAFARYEAERPEQAARTAIFTARAQALVSVRTVPQLCEMWNETTRRLDDKPTVDERMELAMSRAWISDELEKRDALAFMAWMDGGEDPATYYKKETA